jgi:hypothetical protein
MAIKIKMVVNGLTVVRTFYHEDRTEIGRWVTRMEELARRGRF